MGYDSQPHIRMKWNSDDLYHLSVLALFRFLFFFTFFYIFLYFFVDGKLPIDVHDELLERSDLSRASVSQVTVIWTL
jgi:hypothetical protein